MRASGILLHISSLPSDYGIGTLGEEAYKFVDFLSDCGQHYWQILPVCPTSFGDSPYQSFSTFAGNTYFIDLDILKKDGLLEEEEYKSIVWSKTKDAVDYGILYEKRFAVLRKAFSRFKSDIPSDFEMFLSKNDKWISNYGLFMSIKECFDGKPWHEWEDGLKKRDPHTLWQFKTEHGDDVVFWEFLQYEFSKQFSALKEYANSKGISIIGDIPIYVAYDSADVWVYTDLFDLDSELCPNAVAGCPPDAFSATGQLWGNPVYNWQRHRETGWDWWAQRLRASFNWFDFVRIDHFRGFDEYYAIPYGDETAEYGRWEKGPGAEFFDAMKCLLGELPIIAEDLGTLTPSVKELLSYTKFPGMKVLEFAFDSDEPSDYLPHNHIRNSVVYAGTHDNDTIIGWKRGLDRKTLSRCRKYLRLYSKNDADFAWEFIMAAFASVSDTVIIQMQDYLALGSEARMNIPSTSENNWQWRMKKGCLTKGLSQRINEITKLYQR